MVKMTIIRPWLSRVSGEFIIVTAKMFYLLVLTCFNEQKVKAGVDSLTAVLPTLIMHTAIGATLQDLTLTLLCFGSFSAKTPVSSKSTVFLTFVLS